MGQLHSTEMRVFSSHLSNAARTMSALLHDVSVRTLPRLGESYLCFHVHHLFVGHRLEPGYCPAPPTFSAGYAAPFVHGRPDL
jgi:hypothetical protein